MLADGRISCPRWNDRQYYPRRMLRIVIDRVLGDSPAPVVVQRFARVWIHVKAREIAARNIQADTVAALEDKRRRIHLDSELIRLAWLQKLRLARAVAIARANDAVADVKVHACWKISAGRIDV